MATMETKRQPNGAEYRQTTIHLTADTLRIIDRIRQDHPELRSIGAAVRLALRNFDLEN